MFELDDIKKCNKCTLRNDFVSKHFDTKIDGYHAFTFYYDREHTKNAKFIFVMQNPLLPQSWIKKEEYTLLHNCHSQSEFISHHRKHLFKWLTIQNKHFTKPFLELLNRYSLIDYTFENKNLEEKLLSDFIFTDLVKCRANTKEVGYHSSLKCYDLYLKHEFSEYAKNKLIFSFSSRTWDILNGIFEEVGGDIHRKQVSKIAKSHGKLHVWKEQNAFVLPLAHFSQRSFNNYLQDSYFSFLEKGLIQYNKIRF